MLIIGDVHGRFDRYQYIINSTDHSTLQLGDMGIFTERCLTHCTADGQKHRWFRGNHDNPHLCQQHQACLGDFGYDEDTDIFWMAGGQSIDKHMRIPGHDWWPEEELDWDQMKQAIQLYRDMKPAIVVTHDCPEGVIPYVADPRFSQVATYYGTSRTQMALQQMLDEHKPELWVFGHFHTRQEFSHKGVQFVCLHELIGGKLEECVYQVDGLAWS